MPDRYSGVRFRDTRTGQWKKARHWEKNRFYKIDTLSRGMASFVFKTMDEFAENANDFADVLVEYAQANAPWTDRTGAAREGLSAAVLIENGNLIIDLFHTVEYGIWLEVRWGGKFAIIIPTIETMGPRLYNLMNNGLGEIIYYK